MAAWKPGSRGVDEISRSSSRARCLGNFILGPSSPGGLGREGPPSPPPSAPLRPPPSSQARHQRLQFPILPLDGSIGEQEPRRRRREGAGQGGLG